MKCLLAFALVSAGPLGLAAFAQGASSVTPLVVEVVETEAGTLCTISARRVPVTNILTQVTEQLGIRLVGFDSAARTALVDVELKNRPLYSSLDAMLGSIGLRAELRPGLLSVVEANTDVFLDAELIDQAMAGYLRAASLHADHPLAVAARLNQGRIEEERGNFDAALTHFEAVIKNYRASELVPEAMMHAGFALQGLKLWDEATDYFQTLGSRPDSQAYHGRARYELARCAEAKGEYARALQILATLDSNSLPATDEEAARRLVLRARALVGSKMYQLALRKLDDAERIGLDVLQRHEALALRAAAFDGLGLPGEASRAWLIYSSSAVGQQRELALEAAARLALADSDELGTLFIYEQANRDGLGTKVAPYAREARMRLGLDVRIQAGAGTIEGRLDSVDELVRLGRFTDAQALLEPLYSGRSALDEEARTRVALAFARTLEATGGLDQAVVMLSEVRAELEQVEHRRQLDRRAAELFEKHARFDEAIEAYQGRY